MGICHVMQADTQRRATETGRMLRCAALVHPATPSIVVWMICIKETGVKGRSFTEGKGMMASRATFHLEYDGTLSGCFTFVSPQELN